MPENDEQVEKPDEDEQPEDSAAAKPAKAGAHAPTVTVTHP